MNKNMIALAGLLVSAAAVRSWGQIGFGPGQSLDAGAALRQARAARAATAPEAVQPVEWVSIKGGKFTMGTIDGDDLFQDAKPTHDVVLKDFAMSRTLVTVEQYAECVSKGACSAPASGGYCNWGAAGRKRHPVNCVNWNQANQYAQFAGARLPSESEWEYAATSGGKDQIYPWGYDEASCDRAVMFGNGHYGCGNDGTMAVGSKPAGDTAQGLSDMSGEVWEWVQDAYHDSYAGAPSDGSAFEGSGARVLRGGSFDMTNPELLRSDFRYRSDPSYRVADFGFRLAR